MAFSGASLGISARMFEKIQAVNTDNDPDNQCAPRASTYMAIVVGCVAIPYTLYVTWDEYMSKPYVQFHNPLVLTTSLTTHFSDSAYDLLSPKPHSFSAIFTSSCSPPRTFRLPLMPSSTVAGHATKTIPHLSAPNSSVYQPRVPTTQVSATGKRHWAASCSSVSLRGCPLLASQS